MCKKHQTEKSVHPGISKKHKKRLGSALEHGQAHEKEHGKWNRRDFMRMTGLATLGTGLMLNNIPVSAAAPSSLISALSNSDCGDRILVLLRLKGGNDGLNTIIHRGNSTYYDIRPSLAIPESGLWALNDDFGMPNSMIDVQAFWEEGRMQVVHNVGYPEANYSHFRSSDIWASASDSEEVISTGWIGRWLDQDFPAFQSAPPVVPPALQIGVQTNMIFRAAAGSMALSISNPTEFYQIASSGELYDTSGLNVTTPNESELSFVRSVANSAFRYSESIRDAFNASTTQVNYPGNYLAEQMGIVARLIKGNLGTKVYMVSIGGFDTHSDQEPLHSTLLNYVASSVKAFYDDLTASGHEKEVLTMTFSEFGRTIFENGSSGTDHGTGAPMMLFGGDDSIGNGFHGTEPDLDSVDEYGDPIFSVDFRQAYATVLANWLCVHPDVIENVLGNHQFDLINGLLPPSDPPIGSNDRAALLGHNPHPTQQGTIQIKYAMKLRGNVRLQITDLSGHVLRTILNEFKEKNSYTLDFKPLDYYLPSGEYVYKLETGGKVYTRPIRW